MELEFVVGYYMICLMDGKWKYISFEDFSKERRKFKN